MDLEFKSVPESEILVFAEAVLMALEHLNFEYDYDETSPPDEDNEVTYKVYNVKKWEASPE